MTDRRETIGGIAAEIDRVAPHGGPQPKLPTMEEARARVHVHGVPQAKGETVPIRDGRTIPILGEGLVLDGVDLKTCHTDHEAERLINRALGGKLPWDSTAQEGECEDCRGALAANERDRTVVADALAAAKRVMLGYSWATESRGPYRYDDDGYQREFGDCLKAVADALVPLKSVARDLSHCPTTQAGVEDARVPVHGAPQSKEPVLWLRGIAARLIELIQLPRNWDSYGASQIRKDSVESMLGILLAIMKDGDPLPTLVPTAGGGIQAEWHQDGFDFEIEVLSSSRFEVYFGNPNSDEVNSTAERKSTVTPEDVHRAMGRSTDPTLKKNLERAFRGAVNSVRLLNASAQGSTAQERKACPDCGDCGYTPTDDPRVDVDCDSCETREQWEGECEQLARAVERLCDRPSVQGKAERIVPKYLTDALALYRATHGGPVIEIFTDGPLQSSPDPDCDSCEKPEQWEALNRALEECHDALERKQAELDEMERGKKEQDQG